MVCHTPQSPALRTGRHCVLHAQVYIASKVCGPAPRDFVNKGRDTATTEMPNLDRANIRAACESICKRLQTDYIDILYLHWPSRSCRTFEFTGGSNVLSSPGGRGGGGKPTLLVGMEGGDLQATGPFLHEP